MSWRPSVAVCGWSSWLSTSLLTVVGGHVLFSMRVLRSATAMPSVGALCLLVVYLSCCIAGSIVCYRGQWAAAYCATVSSAMSISCHFRDQWLKWAATKGNAIPGPPTMKHINAPMKICPSGNWCWLLNQPEVQSAHSNPAASYTTIYSNTYHWYQESV